VGVYLSHSVLISATQNETDSFIMARSTTLRAGLRRTEEDFFRAFFTPLEGRSSFSLRSPPTKVGGFHQEENPENQPKMQFLWDMNYFLRKRSRSGLRESGWLGTLIKDVRDVAAAVMCSEGPGQSRKRLNRLGFQVI
jgi:hypothetical protein